MDERTHPARGPSPATVPRSLLHFPRWWHERQASQSTQFFDDPQVDTDVTQMLQVVVALRAVSPVMARTEFVKDLRERLMAEALSGTGRPLSAVTAHSGDE